MFQAPNYSKKEILEPNCHSDKKSWQMSQMIKRMSVRERVEFSVPEINLVNPYNDQGAAEKKQKVTYYVQNRFGCSIKVRAALSKNSHPVRWTVV